MKKNTRFACLWVLGALICALMAGCGQNVPADSVTAAVAPQSAAASRQVALPQIPSAQASPAPEAETASASAEVPQEAAPTSDSGCNIQTPTGSVTLLDTRLASLHLEKDYEETFSQKVILHANGLSFTGNADTIEIPVNYVFACKDEANWVNGGYAWTSTVLSFVRCEAIGLAEVEGSLRFPACYNGNFMNPDDWVFMGWSESPDASGGGVGLYDFAGQAEYLRYLLNHPDNPSKPGSIGSDAELPVVDLYATFRPQLAVTFVIDGSGAGNYYFGLYHFPVADSEGGFRIEFVPDPEPARQTGYVFTGWSARGGGDMGEYQKGDIIQVKEPVTLHACWMTVEDYEIYLEAVREYKRQYPDSIDIPEELGQEGESADADNRETESGQESDTGEKADAPQERQDPQEP